MLISMMEKGYAAIIIQNSAGSGKATEYNRSILTHNTLLASIKMPLDLFIGKSSVQTNIYVFRVGEAHQKDDIVKFIDFSNTFCVSTFSISLGSEIQRTNSSPPKRPAKPVSPALLLITSATYLITSSPTAWL